MTENNPETTYKDFMVSYNYKSKTWCFTLKAISIEEAEERLNCIRNNSKLDGEIMLTVEVPSLFNNLVIKILSMFSSIKNFFG